jgi:hypothetical protein
MSQVHISGRTLAYKVLQQHVHWVSGSTNNIYFLFPKPFEPSLTAAPIPSVTTSGHYENMHSVCISLSFMGLPATLSARVCCTPSKTTPASTLSSSPRWVLLRIVYGVACAGFVSIWYYESLQCLNESSLAFCPLLDLPYYVLCYMNVLICIN